MPLIFNIARSCCFGCLLALQSFPASAMTKQQCVDASERAQLLRDEKRLIEAEQSALACTSAECPDPVKEDCAQLLERVRAAIPAIVVRARPESLLAVKVMVDGRIVAERLTGTAIRIDPGPHAFVFEAEGRVPIRKRLLIVEGEQNRLVEVDFRLPEPEPAKPSPAESAPPAPSTSTTPGVGPWILAGAGVGAIGVGTYLGLTGKSDVRDMERTCAPDCESSDIDAAKRRLLAADIAIGVGIGAVAIAGYWFWSSDEGAIAADNDSAVRLDAGLLRGGGFANAAWLF